MLKQIKGDILNINRGIILHQVNCCKVVGGLAGALNRKFPKAFEVYFKDPTRKESRLGQFLIGKHDGVHIAHIFGQFYPGKNTDMKAVKDSLELLSVYLGVALKDDAILYAPFKIGCGLGGGDWSEYEPLLESIFPQLTIVNNE